MMKRIAIAALAVVSLSACARLNMDSSQLDSARKAVADAKAAGAERCAPKLQAEAVSSLYWAAHEVTEFGVHPDETASLIKTAQDNANAARRACMAKPAMKEVIKLKDVYFAHASAKLSHTSDATLTRAVALLKRRANIDVEIAAYTDSNGSDAYNLALSDRRAASVRDYLVSHGINASRLTSKGYGKMHPVATNATKEGRAKNRRVALRVMN